MSNPPKRDLTRQFPKPFGYAAAVETMGAIAAPLLAGFSFALLGLVLQVEKDLRWPDLSMALLAGSGLLFILSLQATFAARRYYVPPDVWVEWRNLATSDVRRDEIDGQYESMLPLHAKWTTAARWTYNVGIVVLFVGVGVLLVPETEPSTARGVAIVVLFAGAVLEIAWTVYGVMRRWIARRARDDAGVAPTPVVAPRLGEAVDLSRSAASGIGPDDHATTPPTRSSGPGKPDTLRPVGRRPDGSGQ